jgi:hypothetical protein
MPTRLRELRDYWVSQGGVDSGIVGNDHHCRGYHLGEDRIFGPCACKPQGDCLEGLGKDDYSVRTARDKKGLSDSASAIDLGKLNGSIKDLRDFSKWLVRRARANEPGTRDIREIIYTPDGKRVHGWSRENGVDSEPIEGYGDDSHLWHTHISFYRDSEKRDKTKLFRPYFEERDMPKIIDYIPGHVATISGDERITVRSAPYLHEQNILRNFAPSRSEEWDVVGWVRGARVKNKSRWLTRWHDGRWEYVHERHVDAIDPPGATATTAALEARIESIKAKVAASAEDIADD